MHIVELHAENIKRLQAVTIRPDGALVIVGGKNGAGKTSTLDSIEMALGGTKSIPPDPVRHGATKGRVVLDLGELIVERTIGGGRMGLIVRNGEGVKQSSPQKLLDGLLNRVAFDPLEFSRMKPDKQDQILRKLVGLDFTELDAERVQIYERRTELNRAARAVQTQLDGLPPKHADAPAEELKLKELLDAYEAARATVDRKSQLDREAAEAYRTLVEKQGDVLALREQLETAEADALRLDTAAGEAKKAADAFESTDVEAAKKAVDDAEATNKQVRANARRAEVAEKLDDAEASADRATESIEVIDEKKTEALAAAVFPVDGLSLDPELGPIFGGVPLEQASQAEQLRVSVAIGLALNPKLRVLLVRDGSLLDRAGLELVAGMAEQAGAQIWMERVSDDGAGCSVVIEDGKLAAPAEVEGGDEPPVEAEAPA